MSKIPTEVIDKINEMYEIPKEQNIKLNKLEQEGFINSQVAKLEIHRGKLNAVKLGSHFFIPRVELIRYLAQQMGLLDDNKDI